MNTLRIVYHLARADFLERTRRYGFLLVLIATIYLGYAINHGDLYLNLDGYRGVLNSAWVGGLMTVSATFLLTLFGFFLVKNAIERDIQTGVGQIIATTPISRPIYLLGKWLSNWAVLAALLGILALAAVLMQLLGGESAGIDLFALLSPLVFVALPALALSAGLAIFFETIPWLRGGLGNVAFFILWTWGFVSSLESKITWFDWSGFTLISQNMGNSLKKVYPAYTGGFDLTGQALPADGLKTFVWPGIPWTAQILIVHAMWVAVALALVFLGCLFFRRFDPTYEYRSRARRVQKTAPETAIYDVTVETAILPPTHLGSLAGRAPRFNFGAVLAAELRLVLKGQPWWWVLGAVGLLLAQFFSPLDAVKLGLLPAAWIWPIFLWSGLGSREKRHSTAPIVFAAPHPLAAQLPAAWLAGFLIAALAGCGALLRFALVGDQIGVVAWVAGACFIPALALALGVWSGSSKLFEVVYVILWYLGPLHPKDMPALDFTGIARLPTWPGFLALAAGLCFLAILGRKYQMQR